MVTLKVLESCKYTHCWLFSQRLHGKCFPLKVPAAPPLESTGTFDIIANEEPTWLFHSDMLYHSHLSPLAAPILAMAVKSCYATSKGYVQGGSGIGEKDVMSISDVNWARKLISEGSGTVG